MSRTHDAPADTAPNRAARRAAARGRSAGDTTGHPPEPRTPGPRVRTAPVHTRADYAARRSG